MYNGNNLDFNSSVPLGSTPKATAKKIQWLGRGNRGFSQMLLRIFYCYIKAKHWEDLSPTERILLELEWTDSADGLLSIGNKNIIHSIRYRLREQTPEEVEEENAV
ncbi:hypothetical protein BH18THE2_BH18THE2_26540 [soil metagenome]